MEYCCKLLNNSKITGGGYLQSRTVDRLRLPLTVMVVFIHSFVSYPVGDASYIGLMIYECVRIFFSHVVSHIAVPVFFLVSGYYFFYGCGGSDYGAKWSRRVSSLLVPYLLWNLAYVIFRVIVYSIHIFVSGTDDMTSLYSWFTEWIHGSDFLSLLWDSSRWDDRFNWFGGRIIMSGPVLLPLWFLRDLLVMVALAPLIHWLVNRIRRFFISALFFLYISGLSFFSVPAMTSLFFFSLGATLAINDETIIGRFMLYRRWAYVLAVLLAGIEAYFDGSNTFIGSLFYPFFICAGVVSAVCMTTQFEERRTKERCMPKRMKNIAGLSFFIFLFHPFILGLCYKAVLAVSPNGGWLAATIGYLTTPLLCVAICTAVYALLVKLAPSVLGILVGERLY